MIKIFCDLCKLEPQDNDFMFDAESKEAMPVFDMNTQNLAPRNQIQHRKFQLCKKCYHDKFLPLLEQ